MHNPLKAAHESFKNVGWAMPSYFFSTSAFVVMLVAWNCTATAFVLSVIEVTAQNDVLTLAFGCGSGGLWFVWVLMVRISSNRMWASESTSGVQHLSTATYSAGAFFQPVQDSQQGRRLSATDKKELNDADWTLCGIKYNPKIANGMVIKAAFAVKSVVKVTSLFLNLARAYIVEFGGDHETYRMLSVAVIVCSGFIVLDSCISFLLGGERGPSARLGKCLYGIIWGKAIPFQPVDAAVHSLQQTVITVQLCPWGILVPLLHEYQYHIAVTSSWLIPMLADWSTLIWAIGGIFYKSCFAAALIGFCVHYGLLSKPPPYRVKEDVKVLAMAYSIWGPFIELKDDAKAIPTVSV